MLLCNDRSHISPSLHYDENETPFRNVNCNNTKMCTTIILTTITTTAIIHSTFSSIMCTKGQGTALLAVAIITFYMGYYYRIFNAPTNVTTRTRRSIHLVPKIYSFMFPFLSQGITFFALRSILAHYTIVVSRQKSTQEFLLQFLLNGECI